MPEGAGAPFLEPEKQGEDEIVDADVDPTLYFVTPSPPGSAGDVVDRRALTRLPILAIFHDISHELGVPPSFTGPSNYFCSRPYNATTNKNLSTQDFSGNGPLFPASVSSSLFLSSQ